MKSKRKIDIDGRSYLWVLEGNEAYSPDRWIIVTLSGTSYSRLYVEPYEHDFEIRPAIIAAAVKSARSMGWEPENNSGEIRLKFREGHFERLDGPES